MGKKMRLILFDLDNTLYPEIDFVKSGFYFVSQFLAEKYSFNQTEVYNRLLDIFNKKGRGEVFNIFLKEKQIFSEEILKLLIYLYRSHEPKIELYNESFPVLQELKKKNYKLGLITNGKASIQKRKVRSLNIESIFDLIIYTDDIGNNREYWKPSIIPFKIILEYFDFKAEESVYIGDDAEVDFFGPKALNMHTIQINCKKHKSAEYEITNLNQITNIISLIDLNN